MRRRGAEQTSCPRPERPLTVTSFQLPFQVQPWTASGCSTVCLVHPARGAAAAASRLGQQEPYTLGGCGLGTTLLGCEVEGRLRDWASELIALKPNLQSLFTPDC